MVSEASLLMAGGGAGLPAGAAARRAGPEAARRLRKRSRSVRPAMRSRYRSSVASTRNQGAWLVSVRRIACSEASM